MNRSFFLLLVVPKGGQQIYIFVESLIGTGFEAVDSVIYKMANIFCRWLKRLIG